MTLNELETKLRNVRDARTLIEQIQNAETDEAALDMLKDHGLEIDEAQLKDLLSSGEELDTEALDLVAGGCSCSWFRKGIVWLLNRLFNADVPCCN